MHQARLGAHVGRRHTGQHRGLQLARETTTGRPKGRKGQGIVGGALAHPGHGVREIVETRAGEPVLPQSGDRFVHIAATVFAGGGGSTHLGDEAAEPCGNRVARPGVGHSDPKTVDAVESEGIGRELMVMGITGQDSQHLARAEANAASNHPDETVTAGGSAQGQAPKQASGIAADHRESRDPIEDRLRTRCLRDATRLSEEPEHTRNGTKADPYLSKESQSQPHEVDVVVHDKPWCLGFVLP